MEWLHSIPKHWRVEALKYLVDVNVEALGEDTDPNYEIAYVDIGNVATGRLLADPETMTFGDAPSRARRIVRANDVIVSTVRTYLKAVARFPSPSPNLIVSTGFAVLRPTSRIGDGYLYYSVLSQGFVGTVVAHSVGVSYPAINPSDLVRLPICLPPLPEQRAIAAFLDRETAALDALVAKKRRLIALMVEKRAALIARAVTRGLDPAAPTTDSSVGWLGAVPAHWQVRPLMRLTPDHRPIMYGIVLPGPHVEDGVPIVKGGGVAPDRLRLDVLKRTTREIEAGYVRSRLRGGDIVYAIRGSIGAAAIVPPEIEGANLTQDAARIAPRDGVDGRWLLYTLMAKLVFAQLDAGATGATIRGINIRDLKRAMIPVPPAGEQRAVAAHLDRETAKLDALSAKLRETIARLGEYRTALIAAAVTGQIDVREDSQGRTQEGVQCSQASI